MSLGGCSSDTGSSGGTTADAGTGGGTDAGDASAVAAIVNACKAFDDRSADSAVRTLNWDFSIATGPDRCVKVKKGQDVTFAGDFLTHPLTAFNGDKPNPIANADAAGKVTFTAVGTFGFQCGNHPAMTGAVQVVE
jgi:plastocyanin